MAVKVFPHSAGNIKPDVKPSGQVMFRWPKGETRTHTICRDFNATADTSICSGSRSSRLLILFVGQVVRKLPQGQADYDIEMGIYG